MVVLTCNDVSVLTCSIPFGPAVRNMMEVYQIRAVDVTATGPGGRLTKRYGPRFVIDTVYGP